MVREGNEKGKERERDRETEKETENDRKKERKEERKKVRKRDTLEFLFNKSRQFRYYFVQNIDLQLF